MALNFSVPLFMCSQWKDMTMYLPAFACNDSKITEQIYFKFKSG